jgi:regulation of enolase protein 1 (concanavalin A-like superfamily)
MFEQCHWLNEPAEWSVSDAALRVVTDEATDFWRETHYGFTRHSGHLFGQAVSGGFTASLRIRAEYESLYDQAGMMILIDEARWVKAGIERSDGAAQLSSVLTLGSSDWATGLFQGDASDFWLRATVGRGVLRLQASTDGVRWPLLRLCPFPADSLCRVGPMCCTPERGGLRVLFSDFSVTPPIAKDLHDLS